MSGMTEGSAVQASLVPPHRRKRVLVAVLVFLVGLVSVSWVGSASPSNSTHRLTQNNGAVSVQR